MANKVIEFEGCDGAGKTTAYNFFIKELKAKGLRVLETREVGNPHIPVCVGLRKLVLAPESNLSGAAMEYIFAAMRIENQRFYESVKDQYDFIVSDRGWLSHLAYTDVNVDPTFTDRLYKGVVAKYTKLPDRVIYLNVRPEVALQRRNTRNGYVDAIEAKGPKFQEKVAESFRYYMREQRIPVDLIDANGTIEEVQKYLKKIVDELEKNL